LVLLALMTFCEVWVEGGELTGQQEEGAVAPGDSCGPNLSF
jgi:hypothetical protein